MTKQLNAGHCCSKQIQWRFSPRFEHGNDRLQGGVACHFSVKSYRADSVQPKVEDLVGAIAEFRRLINKRPFQNDNFCAALTLLPLQMVDI